MPNVEFFYSFRSQEITDWIPIYEEIEKLGYTLHTEPVECDVSVVLNGKFVNPLPLHGEKILFYKLEDWQTMKWKAMFEPILEEYYDEMIDISDRNLEELIASIVNNTV